MYLGLARLLLVDLLAHRILQCLACLMDVLILHIKVPTNLVQVR